MLQINYIRENTEEVLKRLSVKNFDGTEIIKQVIAIDENRRLTQKKLDDILAESNSIAKQIGGLMQQKKIDEANGLKEKTNQLSELKSLQNKLHDTNSAKEK